MKVLRLSRIGKYLLVALVAIGSITTSLPPLPASAALPMAGDASLYYTAQGSLSSPYKTYTALTNTWSSESVLGVEPNSIHFVKTLSSPVRNEKLTLLSSSNGQYRMYRWDGSAWLLDWTAFGAGGSANTYTPRFDFAYDYLGNALVVYGNNNATTNQMSIRKYTGSTGTWSAKQDYTATITNAPGLTRYVRVENRPGTDEYAFVWADYQQNLSGNYYDWSSGTFAGEPSAALMDWLAVLPDAGVEIRTRVFDIAFESNSGELLVCYCPDDFNYLYCNQRTAGMGGSWQAQASYPTSMTADEIDMASDPDPASDKIAFFRQNEPWWEADAAIWDGSSWGNYSAFDMTTDSIEAGTANGAVAWVRSGSTSAVVITYDDESAGGIDWATFVNGTWTVQPDITTAFSPVLNNDIWHELIPDPNNPAQLASVIVDDNRDLSVKRIVFDGSGFTWSSLDNGSSAHSTTIHNPGGWTAAFAWANYLMPDALSVDIIDGSGNSVASPSVTMAPTSSSSSCETTSGTLGTSTQKIRVSNGTTNASWSLSIAATGGSQAKWTASTDTMDYNDNTSSGCADGADADTDAGRLTFSASVGDIAPESSCSMTGVTTPSSNYFSEGTNDSVALLNASTSAERGCYWDLTGVGVYQVIPRYKLPGTYTLPLTLTVTAN